MSFEYYLQLTSDIICEQNNDDKTDVFNGYCVSRNKSINPNTKSPKECLYTGDYFLSVDNNNTKLCFRKCKIGYELSRSTMKCYKPL